MGKANTRQSPTGAERNPSQSAESAQLAPGLYVVATPIGNLGDVTERARAVLAAADLVVCEDTRVTGRLLQHLGLAKPLRAYHEHNAARVRPELLERLERGERLALVSDAGTPGIADPGYRLVREAAARGVAVFAVPGPSAVIAALSIAGLPTDRFFFEGFLPSRRSARRRRLAEIAAIPATLVIYEAPHRIAATLEDALEILGDRPAALARELTKRFEEVRRGTLASLRESVVTGEPPRGELVLVVGPPAAPVAADDGAAVDELLAELLRDHSLKDAVRIAAERSGRPRREVYERALRLRNAAS